MFGGADRDRTDDLCSAIAALSQLSYSPGRSLYFALDCLRGQGGGNVGSVGREFMKGNASGNASYFCDSVKVQQRLAPIRVARDCNPKGILAVLFGMGLMRWPDMRGNGTNQKHRGWLNCKSTGRSILKQGARGLLAPSAYALGTKTLTSSVPMPRGFRPPFDVTLTPSSLWG